MLLSKLSSAASFLMTGSTIFKVCILICSIHLMLTKFCDFFLEKALGGSLRWLNLHEYQSKDLMELHGVLVQKGEMAENAEEAFQIATRYKQEGECQNLNSFKSMII